MVYVGNLDISQMKVIMGMVIEKEIGDLLIGVNVLVKGILKGMIINLNGQYLVDVNFDKDILVFLFIGKVIQEKVVKGLSQIDVVMVDDVMMLGEVVIQIGYMIQCKVDFIGLVVMVNILDLVQNFLINVLKFLQGKLLGVFIIIDGSFGGNVLIQICGFMLLNVQFNLLIVFDGLVGDYNLCDINLVNIELIQVLKDVVLVSIYGLRVVGGVIIIEIKKGKKGELKISYEGCVQFFKWVNKFDLLNIDEYGCVIW